MTATSERVDKGVRSAVLATYAVFIASGIAFASWASRIPQVRDRLHLDPSELGLVLLAIAAGSVIALPLSGVIVGHFGSQWTVRTTGLLTAVAMVVVSLGYLVGVLPVVIGLFLVGLGMGSWDVAMNVQGALAERRLGRAIMPRFHAGFSVGTVVGALIGAGMVALGVPVTVHLLAVAVLVGAAVPLAVRGFLPDEVEQDTPEEDAKSDSRSSGRKALHAWREPRTLLIGLFVLAFAFAEGVGNDWISIALIDGYGTSATVGTLGFATFLAAMTAGRWFGPRSLDRYGRVIVIRVLTVTCLVGVLLFVFGTNVIIAFAGAVLWGVGLALGFPVGMSAGADEPAMAAPRVSVIASIGYCAFLAGPPLIGFLGDHFTVLRAVLAVAVLLAMAMMITGVIRPLTVTPDQPSQADTAS
ncbi:MAG TPA: MFS transporter [Propionibacteriaceae bacterium]|nr:MFS transporter [Propionibacteriaceae bacterium]